MEMKGLKRGSLLEQKNVISFGKAMSYVLGLPDPDSLVRGSDPDPSIIKQKRKEKH
jgi:hypothetical protein